MLFCLLSMFKSFHSHIHAFHESLAAIGKKKEKKHLNRLSDVADLTVK